jgi:hypothetical protein
MRSLDDNFLISSLSSASPSFKFCLSLLQIIYLLKLSARAVYESYISRCVCACSTERCMIDFVNIFKLVLISINIFELQLLLALKQLEHTKNKIYLLMGNLLALADAFNGNISCQNGFGGGDLLQ